MPDSACFFARTSRKVILSPNMPARSFRKQRQRSSRSRYLIVTSFVCFDRLLKYLNLQSVVLIRATDTFGQTMQPAAAWIPSQLRRSKSSPCVPHTMLLVLLTRPRSPTRYSSMLVMIPSSRPRWIWSEEQRCCRNTHCCNATLAQNMVAIKS